MRQIVNEIVHRDLVGEPCPFLGIAGVVGPLPCIAQVHVVADRDHDAAFVVEDGHYVSARWPGDAYLFTQRFLGKLSGAHGPKAR